MSDKSIRVKGWVILAGIPALFLSAYISLLFPSLLELPICSVKSFTGVDCPGCGFTHSIAYLVHGRIRESINYHPLGVIISIWFLYLFLKTLAGLMLKKKNLHFFSQRGSDIVLFVFILGLFIHWIFKLVVKSA